MPVKNLSMHIGDTPNYRGLNLGKIGIPDIPTIYFIRHKQHLDPVPAHYHKDCFEIGLCLRGRFILKNNDLQHNILAGQLFINNPEETHRMLAYPKGTVLYGMLLRTNKENILRFTNKESAEIRKRLYQLPTHLAVNINYVKQSFMDIFHKHETLQGTYRRLCITAACMHLVINLLEATQELSAPSQAERINAIIETLKAAPGKSYNIDALAHQAALSPSHFITQFKQVTGLPPHQFLIKCRLDAAKILLSSTAVSITEIAHELGFCSSQHFSAHFKRSTGITPLTWRKRQKED